MSSPICWRDCCDRISSRPTGLCDRCVEELRAEIPPVELARLHNLDDDLDRLVTTTDSAFGATFAVGPV